MKNICLTVLIMMVYATAVLPKDSAEKTAGVAMFGSDLTRNMVSDETGLPSSWDPESGENIKWTAKLGSQIDLKSYVIQVDVRTDKDKRRLGDAGLVANGYVLDLMGKKKRLEIRSWTSENRIREKIDYIFEPHKWYTLKMTIDYTGGKAIVKGKVWLKDETEPADWTITAEDPYPTTEGSPGLYGVS